MKKRISIIIGIIIVLVCSGYTFFKKKVALQKTEYKTVEILRGTIENVISSTGSLNPVSTVEVGTQVSGTIVKVNVDFNDTVLKGQVIAEIDKAPLVNKLDQVKASYLRFDALFKQAESKYKRTIPLHDKELVSDDEFMAVETDYLAQKAALEGARVEVRTAQNNLTYAIINSPVNGIVISRSVEVGQTVAANFSAPTLFIIAEDLRKMQILADVDESDIGKIRLSQEVSFTVSAYPERTFSGTVSQIRLQPEISQSVVTYSVVINAANDDGVLFPGMTANVDFIAEKVENVLTVSSAALRFKPTNDQLLKLRKAHQMEHPNQNARGDSITGESKKKWEGRNSESKNEGNRGVIWVLEGNNEIRPMFVKTGLSDGSSIEIQGRSLHEGMNVVIGLLGKKKAKEQTSSRTLFGPPRMQGSSAKRSSSGPPPPGGF
jgi:HlyD family secretion protein